MISLCLCSLIPYDLLSTLLCDFSTFLISTESSKLEWEGEGCVGVLGNGGWGGGSYLYLSLINSLSFDLFLNAWAAVQRLIPFP